MQDSPANCIFREINEFLSILFLSSINRIIRERERYKNLEIMSTPCFSIPSVDLEIKSVSFLLKVLKGNLKLKKIKS